MRVRVASATPVPYTPHRHISPAAAREGVRLACRLRPSADLTVWLTEDWLPSGAADATANQVVWDAGALAAEAGRPTADRKGLAVDLGTTTVVATLVALGTGDELVTVTGRNPQIRFGHDVIARIHKGSSPQGLSELRSCVWEALNRLVAELCSRARADQREISDVVVGGNPAMLQLAAGIDPTALGQSPFQVAICGGCTCSADTFGLALGPEARAYIPPIAHAFVGSDISAGLATIAGFFDGADSILFVDLGTNGELVLRSGAHVLATSTAAGPAFEGAGLHSGMPAAEGAIESVQVQRGDLVPHCIGTGPARGLCGSAAIDLTAALLELGVLDITGRMVRARAAPQLPASVLARLAEHNGQPAVRLADGVLFTQEDVRQIQLAKGAIRTAIDLLLERAGACPTRVVLAGGFGAQLRVESLRTIGMVPASLVAEFAFAGNTSRAGCVLLLQHRALREALEARMRSVEYVSLVERADYAERYISNLEFPS
jgi:uncharacterized 2Fe-2S/4Fe-4S cluster protein (DUF4445 family)